MQVQVIQNLSEHIQMDALFYTATESQTAHKIC